MIIRNLSNSCIKKVIENVNMKVLITCQSWLIIKRKHLEKILSAALPDKLLFKETKEESYFRREFSNSFKQSNDKFLQAMDRYRLNWNWAIVYVDQ